MEKQYNIQLDKKHTAYGKLAGSKKRSLSLSYMACLVRSTKGSTSGRVHFFRRLDMQRIGLDCTTETM